MPSGPNHLPKASRPFSTVAYLTEAMDNASMDFITNLPQSEGYDAILVKVDWFSKLAHMVPTLGTTTALETA